MHLNSDELVDLAEGGGTEAAASHLGACAVCQQQVAELREALMTAGAVEVPEPSPLFWQHMAARVREAIAQEQQPAAPLWNGWRRLLSPALVAGAVATIALAVAVTRPRPDLAVALPTGPLVESVPLQPFGAADDPSLAIVAGLAEEMDADAAAEAGATSHVGAVDEAVTNLTADERAELQRLLKEALTKPGA